MLVRVTDPIPSDTTYVPGSVQCIANGSSVTTTCIFDAVNNMVVWEGNLAPDPGATNENNAANEVVISFRTTMPENIIRVENQGCANWDENGNRFLADEIAANQTRVCTDDPETIPSGDATVWTNAEIPTMTEWGMIIFMLLAGSGAVYHLREEETDREVKTIHN